ncbi:hypothetical protein [Leuconostoc mesenteroides]|uniref:hypothetical protein n=1 Tax=Leuconostoc mesenteroides TaxID=1245 RepID=UPI002362AD25|nr:hypothetical protein [Leuconostoc mesenteroides]
MTFDEAVDKSRVLSMDGTKQIYSDDVIQLINELRQEYAPTVEMTDAQYKILVRARNNAVNRVDKVGLLEFMSACSLLNLEIDHLSLMQAWLHPETIKIVDE